jgi:hypothetical protein
MVNCPECGKPLKNDSVGNCKYYCENERCNIMFVRHPLEPHMTSVAYTGFARYKAEKLLSQESDRKPIRQRLKFF